MGHEDFDPLEYADDGTDETKTDLTLDTIDVSDDRIDDADDEVPDDDGT
jgi:hypothetical protein